MLRIIRKLDAAHDAMMTANKNGVHNCKELWDVCWSFRKPESTSGGTNQLPIVTHLSPT